MSRRVVVGRMSSMLINGKFVRDESRTFPVLNPSTGESFATAPDCTSEELDHAVKAAQEAFPAWSARPWDERKGLLLKLAEAIQEHQETIADLLHKENGKPVMMATFEVLGSAKWVVDETQVKPPERVVKDNEKEKVLIQYRPLGVVGCICPWNFPLMMIFFKITHGLLAGNTVVVKPSEHTPIASLKVAELCNDIFPPGVVNFVTHRPGSDIPKLLVNHPGIAKITFTGSTATGKKVMEAGSKDLKRVTLELGGNDAAIVLPDVDPKKVAMKIYNGAFINNGQTCIAIKRIYAHEDIHDALAKELVEIAKKSPPQPLTTKEQYQKVRSIVKNSLDKGAKLLVGSLPDEEPKAGFQMNPMILDAPEDSEIVQLEQFGPAVAVLKYSDVNEVIARANASEYGLTGSVWSKDEGKAAEIASRIQAGTIFVNTCGEIVPPFGGAKASGIGAEGGQEGLLAFMQTHVLKIAKTAAAKL